MRFQDADGREPIEEKLKRQERIDYISFLKSRKDRRREGRSK